MSLGPDPYQVFQAWYSDAIDAGTTPEEAVTLATATPDGKPSVRVVFYKGLSRGRFRFFTNYESRKGQELEANPHAALCFYWRETDHQVRVTGTVERLDAEESDAYFASRARDSQIGAWASTQSRPIADREALQRAFEEFQEKFEGRDVTRPPHWGGYGLTPETFEFWIRGDWRLHDRFLYRRRDDGWAISQLAP